MLALRYQEALQENGYLDLLEFQDALQHQSWKAASASEVTFACYLANKLHIRVKWEPFHPDLIAAAPDATLSALACQVKLLLSIQIEGVMLTATCCETGLDSTMTIQVGDRQYSIPVDGQARNLGLPSLRECISRCYGQARWLYELPGMATDPESDEWADGVKKNPDPLASWHWHWHQQARTQALYHLDPSGVNDSSQWQRTGG